MKNAFINNENKNRALKSYKRAMLIINNFNKFSNISFL